MIYLQQSILRERRGACPACGNKVESILYYSDPCIVYLSCKNVGHYSIDCIYTQGINEITRESIKLQEYQVTIDYIEERIAVSGNQFKTPLMLLLNAYKRDDVGLLDLSQLPVIYGKVNKFKNML